MVQESVNYALAQTYPAAEIVVSDDSADDRTRHALANWVLSGKVRYFHNSPARGQAQNVNHLFDLARGELLVLLHDDDLLLPDAVAKLVACFDADQTITAAFGKNSSLMPMVL